MKRRFLSSRGNIIEIFVENDTILKVNVYCLDFNLRKLTENCRFSCCCKVKIQLLAAEDVLETSTGHRIPVALVAFADPTFAAKSKQNIFILYLNIKEQKCTVLREFFMDFPGYNHHEYFSSDFALLDGPSVFLARGADIFLFSCKKGMELTRNMCSVGQSCGECTCINKVSQTNLFHSIVKCYKTILLVGASFSNHCDSCSQKFGQCLDVFLFEDEIVKLDPNLFIPEEFHETINSISVVDIEIQNHSVLASQVFAATKNGYVLSVQNGQLKVCTSLSNPSKQFLPEYQEDFQLCCFQSKDETYVVVKKVQDFTYLDNTLKVQRQHSNIHHMLYGDFIGNGTVQALFLKASDLSSSAWILDDFNKLCIHSGDPVVEKEDEANSAYTATIALQSRLQQEQSFLEKQEQLLQKKKEFLSNKLTQLLETAAGSGLKHREQKVDLVTLIEGEDIDTEVEPMIEYETQPLVQVHHVWQKTYNSRWCIAVEFLWTLKCSAEVWLQVTPTSGKSNYLLTQSKSVICQAEISIPQDGRSNHCHRTKYPKTDFSVPVRLETDLVIYTATCVTDVPQFLQKSFKVCLTLQWRYFKQPVTVPHSPVKDGDFAEEIAVNSFDSKVLSQSCGEVTLDCADVVAGKHEVNLQNKTDSSDVLMDEFTDVKRCRLAWKLTQTCTELNIKSSMGILSQLDILLTERCSFLYNSNYQCYFTNIPSLHKVQLELSPPTVETSRQMKVFTRSTQDLFLLLHHLYRCLPDNIVILPTNESRKQLQRILPQIQREFHFLSDRMRRLSHSLRRTSIGIEEGDDNYQIDDIAGVREGLKRKREEFMSKENMAVDLSDVKDFLSQLSLYQQNTDSTIARGRLDDCF